MANLGIINSRLYTWAKRLSNQPVWSLKTLFALQRYALACVYISSLWTLQQCLQNPGMLIFDYMCLVFPSTDSFLCWRWHDSFYRSWKRVNIWTISIWLSCRNYVWGIFWVYRHAFITDYYTVNQEIFHSYFIRIWKREQKLWADMNYTM